MTATQPRSQRARWLLAYVAPPLALLLLAGGSILLAMRFKPEPERAEPKKAIPAVEYVVAKKRALRATVESQGTVQPRSETTLVAEVGGRVERVASALFPGGRFAKGDVLLEIDPADHRAALADARSRRADARLALEQEEALAAQAFEDWLGYESSPISELALREPQLEAARARLEAAEAAVALAERNLERTRIRAPYNGVAREKFVDVGDFLAPQSTRIAIVFATDRAEVRLPVSLRDLAYLPMAEIRAGEAAPPVEIRAARGGRTRVWDGRIVRAEGAIDPGTRMAYLVASVDRPYCETDDRPPLKAGSFVTATIFGHRLEEAIELPRAALRQGEVVHALGPDDRLDIRPVSVYQAKAKSVIIDGGLADGERVALTSLEAPVQGMRLAPESAPAAEKPEPAPATVSAGPASMP